MNSEVRLASWIAAIGLAIIVGCNPSDRVHVSGRVTRQGDGSPVVRARVILRSPATGATASGQTDDDGKFDLGTVEPGDGVPPGEYTVAITEDRGNWDAPKPRTIHPRYDSPKTSGLSFNIDAKTDQLVLELESPPPIERRER